MYAAIIYHTYIYLSKGKHHPILVNTLTFFKHTSPKKSPGPNIDQHFSGKCRSDESVSNVICRFVTIMSVLEPQVSDC